MRSFCFCAPHNRRRSCNCLLTGVRVAVFLVMVGVGVVLCIFVAIRFAGRTKQATVVQQTVIVTNQPAQQHLPVASPIGPSAAHGAVKSLSEPPVPPTSPAPGPSQKRGTQLAPQDPESGLEHCDAGAGAVHAHPVPPLGPSTTPRTKRGSVNERACHIIRVLAWSHCRPLRLTTPCMSMRSRSSSCCPRY